MAPCVALISTGNILVYNAIQMFNFLQILL